MTQEQVIWFVFTTITGGIVALFWWMFNRLFETNKNQREIMQVEIDNISKNYLARFEKVNENITDSKEEVVALIHKLEMQISDKIHVMGTDGYVKLASQFLEAINNITKKQTN